jgi:hypothetical protein
MTMLSQARAPRDDIADALDVLGRAGMLAVWPKRPSPTEAAEEAVEQIAFQLVSLQDAINDGAFVSPEKRDRLTGFVRMMQRMGFSE